MHSIGIWTSTWWKKIAYFPPAQVLSVMFSVKKNVLSVIIVQDDAIASWLIISFPFFQVYRSQWIDLPWKYLNSGSRFQKTIQGDGTVRAPKHGLSSGLFTRR